MAHSDSKSKKWRATPRYNNQRLPTKSFSTKTLAEKYEQQMERLEEEKFVKGTHYQDYTDDKISSFGLLMQLLEKENPL